MALSDNIVMPLPAMRTGFLGRAAINPPYLAFGVGAERYSAPTFNGVSIFAKSAIGLVSFKFFLEQETPMS